MSTKGVLVQACSTRLRPSLAAIFLISLTLFVPGGFIPRARATTAGLICIADQTVDSTDCPSSPANLTGNVGDTVTVAVNVQGVDALNWFDVSVKVNPAVMQPLGISISGSVIHEPRALVEPSIDKHTGLVQLVMVAAGYKVPGPVTGNLFQISYKVLSSNTTIVAFALGCPGTSVAGVCVTLAGPSPIEVLLEEASFGFATPDFSMSANFPDTPYQPLYSYLSVRTGSHTSATLRLNAWAGFSDAIDLSVAFVSPCMQALCPTASLNSTKVSFSFGVGWATLTVAAPIEQGFAPPTYWKLNITGKSGSLSHSAQLTIQVIPPDFSITIASPSESALVHLGSTDNVTIALSSAYGFGIVNLTATLTSDRSQFVNPVCSNSTCPSWTLNPSSLNLSPGAVSKAVLIFSAPQKANTPVTYWNFIVNGTGGKLSHSAFVELTVIGVGCSPSCKLHDPINISRNSDFDSENGVTQGTGTPSDPYVIENLDITSQRNAPGISISDTSESFVIRKVYIHSNTYPTYGISMTNVSNGTVEGSQIALCCWSVAINYSGNITVSNDLLSFLTIDSSHDVVVTNIVASGTILVTHSSEVELSRTRGADIKVDSTLDLQISDNDASIDVSSSARVSIQGNRARIGLIGSSNVTISDNRLEGGCDCIGLSMERSDHVMVSDNSISGEPGITAYEGAFIEISNNRVQGIILNSCSNVDIQGNQVEIGHGGSPPWGIGLNACSGADIVENNITGLSSSFDPRFSELIKASLSSNVTIRGNNLSNSTVAVGISLSSDIVIDGNAVQANTQGVVLNETVSVRVFHNNFLNNVLQAIDTGSTRSIWDNGYPSGGNYWSDYSAIDRCSGPNQDVCSSPDGIADEPRPISQTIPGYLSDRYPLMKPFASLVSGTARFEPASITFEIGARYLTAVIGLPQGFSPSDVIVSSIRLNQTISAAIVRSAIQTKASVLIVAFDMSQIQALFSIPRSYVLRISGNILTEKNFRPFEATSTILLLPFLHGPVRSI